MDLKTLEAKAEKALVFLHEKAGEHAEARAQADHLSDWVKVEKSRVMGLYTALSAAAAEAEALRHPDYAKALEAVRIARKHWYEIQFKREAAKAFIDAFQTVSANSRNNV
jgi:hypothetical protein